MIGALPSVRCKMRIFSSNWWNYFVTWLCLHRRCKLEYVHVDGVCSTYSEEDKTGRTGWGNTNFWRFAFRKFDPDPSPSLKIQIGVKAADNCTSVVFELNFQLFSWWSTFLVKPNFDSSVCEPCTCNVMARCKVQLKTRWIARGCLPFQGCTAVFESLVGQ